MPHLSCAWAEHSCVDIFEVTYCSLSRCCQSCSYYMCITFHERCWLLSPVTYFEAVSMTLTVNTELLYICLLLLMVIPCRKLSRLNKNVQVECFNNHFTKTNSQMFEAFTMIPNKGKVHDSQWHVLFFPGFSWYHLRKKWTEDQLEHNKKLEYR